MDSTRPRCARLSRRVIMSGGSGMRSTAEARQCLMDGMRQATVRERGCLLVMEAMILEPLRYTSSPEWVSVRCHRSSIWMTLARGQVTVMSKGTIREEMRDTTGEVVRAPAVGPNSDGGIPQRRLKRDDKKWGDEFFFLEEIGLIREDRIQYFIDHFRLNEQCKIKNRDGLRE